MEFLSRNFGKIFIALFVAWLACGLALAVIRHHYRPQFMAQCQKDGHTKTECQMMWRVTAYGG